MTARILVVDDGPPNVKLLEARLVADYFDVLTAGDGEEALEICRKTQVDLVLLDVLMPKLNGFEVCAALKADPRTMNVPVVIVTALEGSEDRVRGLEAGADDFLTKPVNDIQLITRVRSLLRLKALSDELHSRAETAHLVAAPSGPRKSVFESVQPPPHILVVDPRPMGQERAEKLLPESAEITVIADPQTALFEAAERPYDLVLVGDRLNKRDPLRFCSQLRSDERTRFTPIMLIADPDAEQIVTRALDLGVNDYILRPIDRNELTARVATQVRRKRYNDDLRRSMRETFELAVTDGLTGLHNRRYLDTHLLQLIERARGRDRALSICMVDIDRFKTINDQHGHDSGDDVLREIARRIRETVRGIDLACRYGGEEFVVVMPDANLRVAHGVAERLRAEIQARPFMLKSKALALDVTASLGIATLRPDETDAAQLFRRADEALYKAKRGGRNRVVADAA